MIKKFRNWPKVSILVSNYNGVKLNLVIDSLTSIIKCDYPNYEIFLIDNASTDNSVEVINKKFGKNKKLKVINNKVDMYTQGLNLGLEQASGEYIAFFNNDIEYRKGYFKHIIKTFNKYPDVYLVQGKLLNYYNHKIIDSVGETMDIYGNPITQGAGEEDKGQYEKVREVLSASGSASVIRAEAFKIIGKFDEDYGLGYEDMDIAFRIRLRGFRVLYIPKAVIYHKRGKTNLSSDFKVEARWYFNKNRLSTMIKNYPPLLLITSLPITFLLYITAALWEIFIKRKPDLGLTRFSAIFWIYKNLPSLLKKRANIRKDVNEKEEQNMLKLISNRPLFKSFLSFVKTN